MKTYSSIIFDLDDTLWDTKQNSKDALNDIFNDYNLGRFYEKYEDFYILFLTLNESLWEQYNQGKISKEELQNTRFRKILSEHTDNLNFLQMNENFIETTCSKSKLIDGAHEILEYLSEKYKLTILSNSFEKALTSKVNSSGFAKYFTEIYSSESIGINKPNPKAFEYILEKHGYLKENSIMIGDNLHSDILGAKNSGIDQAWFTTEINIELDFQPTYRIRRLLDLKDFL